MTRAALIGNSVRKSHFKIVITYRRLYALPKLKNIDRTYVNIFLFKKLDKQYQQKEDQVLLSLYRYLLIHIFKYFAFVPLIIFVLFSCKTIAASSRTDITTVTVSLIFVVVVFQWSSPSKYKYKSTYRRSHNIFKFGHRFIQNIIYICPHEIYNIIKAHGSRFTTAKRKDKYSRNFVQKFLQKRKTSGP